MLFRGTRHHTLISFETEWKARRQTGHQLRHWCVELINHEHQEHHESTMPLINHECLDASKMVGTLVSPRPCDLPRLPPWAAPNGWDYWSRPWAYFDVPSSHNEVGVSSMLTPPSTRITVAVLVDCPHEPQFLPDMVLTQSEAAGGATC